MEAGWIWAVIGLAIVIVLIIIMIGYRRSRLLSAPGSFGGRLVVKSSRALLKTIPAVVSYNEATVEVFTLSSISPMPKHTLRRHLCELHRTDMDNDKVKMSIEEPASGRAPVEVIVDKANFFELSAWHEAGPSIGIGHWREAPRRRQRRRYF